MQGHLLAARAGRVRRKSRQDEIAAEQFVHHRHRVGMLDNFLEDLAFVDQVEDALVRAIGFEKCDAVLAFQMVQAVEVVTNATEEIRGDKIWHDAYAAFFNFTNNLIDIVLASSDPFRFSFVILNDRLILRQGAENDKHAGCIRQWLSV